MARSWTSARAGVAVVEEHDTYRLLTLAQEVPATPSALRNLTLYYPDVVSADADDDAAIRRDLAASHAIAAQRLEAAGLLDAGFSSDLRRELALRLERLGTQALLLLLRDLMFTQALPADADLVGTLSLAKTLGLERLETAIARVAAALPTMRRISDVWRRLLVECYASSREQDAATEWMASSGGFLATLEAVESQRPEVFGEWVVSVTEAPRVLGPQPALVLARLLKELASRSQSDPDSVAATRDSGLQEADRLIDQVEYDTAKALDALDEWNRYRRELLRGAGTREIVGVVRRQLKAVFDALDEGDTRRASRYLSTLIDSQLARGDTGYAVRSLCNAARRADQRGLIDFAENVLRQAVQLAPDDRWSWRQLADVLVRVGRLDEALSACDSAISADPTNVVARSARAEVLKAQGRLDEALGAYDEIIRRFPQEVVPRAARAEVLRGQGHYRQAEAAYREALMIAPDDLYTRNGLANVLMLRGNYTEAVALYRRSIRSDPESGVARDGLAQVFRLMGRLGDALRVSEDSIRDVPDSPAAYRGRARIYRAQGRYELARGALETAVERFPDQIEIRTSLGEIERAMGDYEAALKTFREAIELVPSDSHALRGFARTRLAMGQSDEAVSQLQSIAHRFPFDVRAQLDYADGLRAAGKRRRSLAAYDEAAHRFPEDRRVIVARARAAAAFGRVVEARQLTRANVVGHQDWDALLLGGLVELRTGGAERAMKSFELGAIDCPDAERRDEFRTALGVAYLELRLYRHAADRLSKWRTAMLHGQSQYCSLLLAHAWNEIGDRSKAELTLDGLDNSDAAVSSLRESLSRRYSALDLASRSRWRLDTVIREREFQLLAA